MFDLLVGVATIASCAIAWLAFQHQRNTTSARNSTQQSQPEKPSPNAQNPEQDKPAIPVPDGITFGDKAVLVPGLQGLLFTHSGTVEENIWQGKSYSWIRRGDVIGRYRMQVRKSNADYVRHILGSSEQSVDILSPVSGLLLHPTYGTFGSWPSEGTPEAELPVAAFAVLIADDEPAPEKNEYLFRRLIDFVTWNKAPLFRASERWTLGPLDEEQFQRLLKVQQTAECLIVDALPRYADYLDEARTRYPGLRPHLKHLAAGKAS